MLKDDEAIGEVANYIIRADIRYNPEKGMNPNSWRMLNGKYGVLVFLEGQSKQKRHLCIDEIPVATESGLMENIFVNEIKEIVETDDEISTREREMFSDRYVDRMSLRAMGKKHKLTHERIRQILEGIHVKIRKHYESGS
jgi:DNA-directed RNA polymerase specialized sigma subunit